MKDPSEFEVHGGTPLYQLKITLKRFEPKIWRRVLVRADIPLNRLHTVIQRTMGWTNSHLHQFVIDGVFFGIPDPEMEVFESRVLNEKRYVLAEVAPRAKKKFLYEYDFGDSWEHEIVVEKILSPDSTFKRPSAWQARWHVLPKTAAASGATTICCRPWPIQNIGTMRTFRNGSGANGMPSTSIWKKRMHICRT